VATDDLDTSAAMAPRRNSMTRFLIAALAMMLAAPAMAEDVASATSPGGTLKVDLSLNGEGRVGYRISRSGKSIIDESHLGFLFTDAPQMLRTFKLVSSTTHDVSTSWEQPWGEWRTVADRHRELDATFEETGPLHRRMEVQFRLFDDGVGFRVVMPKQPNLATANIAEELTQFAVHGDGTAWWDPAFESNREEYLFNRTPIADRVLPNIGQRRRCLTTEEDVHEQFIEEFLSSRFHLGEINRL